MKPYRSASPSSEALHTEHRLTVLELKVEDIEQEIGIWRDWIKRAVILALLFAGATGGALNSGQASDLVASVLQALIGH